MIALLSQMLVGHSVHGCSSTIHNGAFTSTCVGTTKKKGNKSYIPLCTTTVQLILLMPDLGPEHSILHLHFKFTLAFVQSKCKTKCLQSTTYT